MPIPLPVIPQTYRIALLWRVITETAVNVIHIRTTAAGVSPAEVYELLQDTFDPNLWLTVGSGATIEDVAITPLDGVSATSHFAPGGAAAFSGSATGQAIPQVAVIVKWETGVRGRNHRGRIFLPFTTEDAVAGGFVSGGLDVTMTTAWTNTRAAIVADATTPGALVVASYDRRHGGAGAIATPISNSVVEHAVGTQRRRQQRLR